MDNYEQISLLFDLKCLCFSEAARLEREAITRCGPQMRRLRNRQVQKLRSNAAKLGVWKEQLEQQAREALTAN